MKVLLIGATGTIGRAVARELSDHEVIEVGFKGGRYRVDLEDSKSIAALFEQVGAVDAIISTAGAIAFAPLTDLTEAQFRHTITNKLLGNVNLLRIGHAHVRDGGSITFTSGYLAQHPMPGSAAVSMVNAGLDAFAKAAALELAPRIRVNTVSPVFVKETMEQMGMDSSSGVSAADTAKGYRYAIESDVSGEAIDVRDFQ